MFALLQAGGFLIWPILLCSVVAFAIMIERGFALRRHVVSPPELIARVGKVVKMGEISVKMIDDIERSSALGRIIAAALRNSNQHRVVLKEVVEEAGRHAVHDLEKNLQALGTIASVAPLLGLLGTVVGMIKVFAAITTFGVGDPQALAEGISEALVTTAAGLSVGIPSLIMHRFFQRRINELSITLERRALVFIKILQQS